MKKAYEAPVLSSERIVLGVFGCYNSFASIKTFNIFRRRGH